MNRTYPSVMTLTSPLAHTERSVGIDAKFRRLTMHLDGAMRKVPVLSGNAIRGLLRRASMATVLERCGVARGSLSPTWVYLLSAGGTLGAGETRKAFDPAAVRALRELLVPLAAFGGSVQGGILPGELEVDMAVPITIETQRLVGADDTTMRLGELLEEIPYARKDDLVDRDAGAQGAQMRYSVECLRPGVRLAHGLSFRTADVLVRGCVWDAVARVAEQRLGGKGATGHGAFRWTWTPDVDQVAAYHAHVDTHAEALRERLSRPL